MWVHVVVDVFLHFGLGGETPPAVGHRATKGPIALMGARVLVQYRLLTEIFAALLTLVRLLAGMNAQMLIQDGTLTEITAAVDAAVRFLVRVDAKVLGQVRLLPEPLAALRARIRSRLDVYAAVLQQRRFLLELLLTDRASHVQRHARGAAVLYHVRQTALATALLLDVLESTEATGATGTENRVIPALRVFEVSRILDRVGVRRRAERTRLCVRVAERRSYLLLALLRWKRYVLRPECRRHSILEDQMRAHVCNRYTRTKFIQRVLQAIRLCAREFHFFFLSFVFVSFFFFSFFFFHCMLEARTTVPRDH